MARIEQRLAALGLVLPPPVKPPPGVVLPFKPVRLIGRRALVSGHGPQNDDGSIGGPLGKVGGAVSLEKGKGDLTITYVDTGFAPAEVTISVSGVTLEKPKEN